MNRYLSNCIVVSMAILSLSSFAFAASVWTTDAYGNSKLDFAPSEPVYIHGSAFAANSDVAVSVTDPFISTSTGTVISDASGNFVYEYLLLKTEGTYHVIATDGTNSAETVFTDASVWTTDGVAQQKNSFSCGEVVGIDGDGLTPSTTLSYIICDSTGGSPCNGNVAASGTVTTDSNGDISFQIIWNVPQFYPNGGTQHKLHVFDQPAKTKTFDVTCECVDNDQDGYPYYDANDCPTGNDCDDNDATVNPGASEICNNQIDDDCDGYTDCADSDCTGNPVCGFCGNGVIETGEQCDDGNTNNGDCCSSTCNYEPSTTVCRASAGVCDVVEKCTGSSASCPADYFFPATTICRASAGVCDVMETCTGTSAFCPADAKSTAQCRASAGICDVAESCNGVSNNCPADAFRPYGYVCAYESGQCEADDICDGFSAVCNEKYALSGTSCNDNLYCNVGETCNGMGACTGGSARDCSDGVECTYDNCDETNDICDNSNKPYGTDCGSARDCPFDACSNPFWYDYNDDGHDYCSSGICIIWKCGYTSTCETLCGASCESDADCTSYCSGNGRYYSGDCDTSATCSCSYSYESCGTQARTCTLGENCNCESGKYVCDTGDDKNCENGCAAGTCNSACTPPFCDRTNQGTDSDADGYDNECETCDTTYCRQSPTAEICNNGCDDDCDGYEDCEDSDCVGETGPSGKECCQSASTCDDSNICTDDACSSNECVYTNNKAPCEDGQYCTVNDICSGGSCTSGSARDCSAKNLPTIDECGYVPDSNPFTVDYAPGFTSKCDEENNECTTGSYSFTHTCSVLTCGADCDSTHACDDNRCSETYNDYCVGKKLYEYDSDKVLDSTTVTDSCSNDCLGDCTCTDCKTDCSAPSVNNYCVTGVCGAECDPSTTPKRCLPEGTSITTVMNGKCYITPEFDTCYANCTWSGCQKVEIPITDPRCNITVTKPSCGSGTVSCYSGCCPITTTTRTTTTISRTTTTLYKPVFTIPTFTFPKFTLPTFTFPSLSFR